ncbi:MAG: DUF4167 domain-containing protein [Alphaproteobacteria bacterium]|nr:DUF4167 domain-containing protein [Alphaproteobacteria bacterium]
MRQNPNSRRSRGRGNRKPGNSRNQIFDSNGPGARVRGNSAQIYEKYQQLARDASSSGDRVAAEGFYQHAEHYYRLMEAAGLNREGNPQEQSQQQQGDDTPKNGNVAPNGEAAVAAEPAPQPTPQPASRPTPKPASEHAPESVAALIEAVEQGSTDGASGEATNGSGGDGEVAAKPARRSRTRRPNGSANGRNKPVKAAEGDAPEDGSDKPPEDSEPASA